MKEYVDVDEMWSSAIDDVIERGRRVESRNGESTEIVGWSGRLLNPRRNFLQNRHRAACPTYASAELIWYLSRLARVDALLPYAPSYKRFAEPNGEAHGAYGRRIGNDGRDLILGSVERLRREPLTRQCLVSMWRPDDLFCSDKKDVPCTICWQFLLREHNLHMVVYMRSNDLWLGFPYDVYTFTCVQQMMAASLGVGIGTYVHNVGSCHVYDGNRLDACQACDLTKDERYRHKFVTPENDWAPCPVEDGDVAVAVERAWRTQQFTGDRSSVLKGCLADSVACVGRRWGIETTIVSSALRKGLENVHNRRQRLRGKDDTCAQDRQESQ